MAEINFGKYQLLRDGIPVNILNDKGEQVKYKILKTNLVYEHLKQQYYGVGISVYGYYSLLYYVQNGIPEVLRDNEWTLRRTKANGKVHIELFNLTWDPAERVNLAEEYKKKQPGCYSNWGGILQPNKQSGN